ncbi:hypothetical protein EGV97_04345 [Helicobacter pylori]|uniref:Uncharacterized protein n=2 Tax=Helicobacter pylori TaxID=210 RepID=A0A7Z6YBA1_HELPX|nr:hypothetical protein [Helicobacter pylori]RPF69478.1 hypothetical protein EGV97_04345 [Helicobacter pylori]
MWHEKFLKVIPAVVFLFCLLEILELVLIINDMNKTEKLESEIKNDLKVLQDDINFIEQVKCNSI